MSYISLHFRAFGLRKIYIILTTTVNMQSQVEFSAAQSFVEVGHT